MRTHQTLYLTCTFTLALLVPLLPFILNGAPFIGDTWIHLDLAEDITATGSYSLSSYNERWPLINLLIAFIMLIGGLNSLQASQVVPLLVGLASLSIYAVCRRLGLPRGASVLSVLFLTFNPLYSYVTFAGAVMKETATYHLTMLMLLAATLALQQRTSKTRITLCTLVGLGIVLGHHFAGLIIFLFLWALTGFVLLDKLRGGRLNLFNAFAIAIGFSTMLVSWNLFSYLAIGPFHPVFNITDLALLTACFILLWASLFKDKGIFSSRTPWLILAVFLIAVLGLRGGIYILAQPVDPINIWEYRDLLITAAFALTGLVIFSPADLGTSLKKHCLKAYATAAVCMLLFAFVWGHSYPGFVLLIKSLHYFGPLLAMGAGFTTAALLRKGNIGKLVAVVAIIFIIYASSTGTNFALDGLGAYSKGEFEAASNLPPISSQIKVYGDTRVGYLFPYASGLTTSQLKPLEDLESNALITLLKPNQEKSFLHGYDWVIKRTIAPDEQLLKRRRVYDSPYLQAWL